MKNQSKKKLSQSEFNKLLLEHDWYFEMSESKGAYINGKAQQQEILEACKDNPEFSAQYYAKRDLKFEKV